MFDSFFFHLALYLAISLLCSWALLLGYNAIDTRRKQSAYRAELEGLQTWVGLYLDKTRAIPGDTLQERLDYLLLQHELLSEESHDRLE